MEQEIKLEAAKIYPLELNGEQIVYITSLLSKQPYIEVHSLISNISNQIK